ncbi:YhhN-like protein [Copromyces sp. CBS 386.78]|nr:YhhN-like protein [Copromyces sp. CBS 386.78]
MAVSPYASLDKTVLAVSLASAILYLFQVRSTPSYSRMLVKTASTALLSYLSHLLNGPQFLTGALALGSLGDAFLAWHGDTAFLCGLSSFLLAHIGYILLFLHEQPAAGFQTLLQGWRTATAAGLVVVLVPFMMAMLMPKVGKALRVPVLVYSLTICVMALTALTLESGRVIVGATMFTASDSILAADKFLVPGTAAQRYRPLMQRAVWVLYYGGQALIALGFVEPAL